MEPHAIERGVTVYNGDCVDVLANLPAESVDAVVTDPPYGLEFMGKQWAEYRRDVDAGSFTRWTGDRATGQGTTRDRDNGPAGRVAYGGGTRATTSRCTGCGKRDQFRNPHECTDRAEWRLEILDPFAAPPTSVAFQEWTRLWALQVLRVLKPGGYVFAFGATRLWHRLAAGLEDGGLEIRDNVAWLYGQGFPKSMNVADAIATRKGASAEEVARAGEWHGWGTALKPAHEPVIVARRPLAGTVAWNVLEHGTGALHIDAGRVPGDGAGRWPANVAVDEHAGDVLNEQTRTDLDTEGAARFYFQSKANGGDRLGSEHPTVKPVDVMRWLVRLATPPGGVVLDPFAGTGTTGEAAIAEGFGAILVEKDAQYLPDILRRLKGWGDTRGTLFDSAA